MKKENLVDLPFPREAFSLLNDAEFMEFNLRGKASKVIRSYFRMMIAHDNAAKNKSMIDMNINVRLCHDSQGRQFVLCYWENHAHWYGYLFVESLTQVTNAFHFIASMNMDNL